MVGTIAAGAAVLVSAALIIPVIVRSVAGKGQARSLGAGLLLVVVLAGVVGIFVYSQNEKASVNDTFTYMRQRDNVAAKLTARRVREDKAASAAASRGDAATAARLTQASAATEREATCVTDGSGTGAQALSACRTK